MLALPTQIEEARKRVIEAVERFRAQLDGEEGRFTDAVLDLCEQARILATGEVES